MGRRLTGANLPNLRGEHAIKLHPIPSPTNVLREKRLFTFIKHLLCTLESIFSPTLKTPQTAITREGTREPYQEDGCEGTHNLVIKS